MKFITFTDRGYIYVKTTLNIDEYKKSKYVAKQCSSDTKNFSLTATTTTTTTVINNNYGNI